jgi:hypothetical protein
MMIAGDKTTFCRLTASSVFPVFESRAPVNLHISAACPFAEDNLMLMKRGVFTAEDPSAHAGFTCIAGCIQDNIILWQGFIVRHNLR